MDDVEDDRADAVTVAEPEMEVDDRQSEGEQMRRCFRTRPITKRKLRQQCLMNVVLCSYQNAQWIQIPISCRPE